MLQEAREEARDALLAGISSPRYTKLLAAFEAALSALPPLEEDDALRRPVHGVQEAEEARRPARRRPADEALHALRKSGKRARYAGELAGLGGDRRIRRFVKAVEELQDVVGEHQDSVVAEERIRQVARRAAAATAGGRLIERERARRRARGRRIRMCSPRCSSEVARRSLDPAGQARLRRGLGGLEGRRP